MANGFMDIALTDSVRQAQRTMGADHLWSDRARNRASDRFSTGEIAFIGRRDSFYMASVSETGWPYVQHRGGPAGFLKVLDDRTLAFLDYRGNRQYISTGNLAANPHVCLFLVDYPARARLKIYARAEQLTLDAETALTAAVTETGYRARAERIFRLHLAAFDWNCPQHIVPRYTEAEVRAAVSPLHERISQLEQENDRLRAHNASDT